MHHTCKRATSATCRNSPQHFSVTKHFLLFDILPRQRCSVRPLPPATSSGRSSATSAGGTPWTTEPAATCGQGAAGKKAPVRSVFFMTIRSKSDHLPFAQHSCNEVHDRQLHQLCHNKRRRAFRTDPSQLTHPDNRDSNARSSSGAKAPSGAAAPLPRDEKEHERTVTDQGPVRATTTPATSAARTSDGAPAPQSMGGRLCRDTTRRARPPTTKAPRTRRRQRPNFHEWLQRRTH